MKFSFFFTGFFCCCRLDAFWLFHLSHSPSWSTMTTWKANQHRKCPNHSPMSPYQDCLAVLDANASPSDVDCRTRLVRLPSLCINFQLNLLSPDSSALNWWRKPSRVPAELMFRSTFASCVDVPSCSRALSVDCWSCSAQRFCREKSKVDLKLIFNRSRCAICASRNYPPELFIRSASSSHFCRSGFSLHIFLKLRLSASKRDMVVCEKSFP